MKIRTNNKPRELFSGWELDEKTRKHFDYIAQPHDIEAWIDCHNRFFRFNNAWYDVQEFCRIEKTRTNPFTMVTDNPELLSWHGYQSDSYFSGLLIRFNNDFSSVVVGSYCS